MVNPNNTPDPEAQVVPEHLRGAVSEVGDFALRATVDIVRDKGTEAERIETVEFVGTAAETAAKCPFTHDLDEAAFYDFVSENLD